MNLEEESQKQFKIAAKALAISLLAALVISTAVVWSLS